VLENERNLLQQSVRAKDDELDKSNQELDALRKELDDMKAQMQELEDSVIALNDESERLQNELIKAENENAEIQVQLDAGVIQPMTASSTSMMAPIPEEEEQGLQDTINVMSAERDELVRLGADLENQNQALKEKLTTVQQSLFKAEAEKLEMHDNHTKEMKARETEYHEKKKDADRLKFEVLILKASLEKLRKKKYVEVNDVATDESDIFPDDVGLKDVCVTLERENQDLKTKNSQLMDEKEDLKERMEETASQVSHSDEAVEVQSDLLVSKMASSDLEEECARLRAYLKTTEAERVKDLEALRDAQDENNQLREALESIGNVGNMIEEQDYLLKEIESLKQTMEELTKDKEAAQEEEGRLREALAEAQKRLQELEHAKEHRGFESLNLSDENEELKTAIENMERENHQIMQAMEQMEAESAQHETRANRLEGEKKELHEALDVLQKENKKNRQMLDRMNKESAEACQVAAKLQDEQPSLKRSLETAEHERDSLRAMNEELEKMTSDLRAMVDQMQATYAELQSREKKNSELQSESFKLLREGLEQENKDLGELCELQRKQLQSAMEHQNEAKAAQLQLQEEVDQLRASLDQKDAENRRLKSEGLETNKMMIQAAESLQSQERHNIGLGTECDNLKSKLQDVTSAKVQLETANEELEYKINALEGALERMEKRLKEKTEAPAEANPLVRRLQSENQQLKTSADKLRAKSEAQEEMIEKMKIDVASLRERNEHLEASLHSQENSGLELDVRLRRADMNNTQLTTQNKALDRKVSDLELEKADLESQVRSLGAEKELLEEHVREMDKDNVRAEEKIKKAGRDRQGYRTQIDSLHAKIKELEDARAVAPVQAPESEKRSEKIHEKIKRYVDENIGLHARLRACEQEISELRAEKQQLVVHNEKLMREKHQQHPTTNGLDAVDNHHQELKASNLNLSQKVHDLGNNLSNLQHSVLENHGKMPVEVDKWSEEALTACGQAEEEKVRLKRDLVTAQQSKSKDAKEQEFKYREAENKLSQLEEAEKALKKRIEDLKRFNALKVVHKNRLA
jgi:myosin protein heavy chain